jgi:predicted dehydrogenase
VKKVNLCILGCGAIARLHSRVARTLRSQVNLLFASRSLETAEAYNRRYRGIAAFGDYESACADPRVDAVFICTPHALHVEHARLATRQKKAILIEKPVTRTLRELAEIEREVAEAGVIAMVAENYHFKPLIHVLHEHLGRGDVGDVLFVEVNKAGQSKIRGWRSDAEMMGGGALLEGGVHWVNLLVNIGGDVEAVIAAHPTKDRHLIAPFEDSLELLVKFADGTVGKMLHSWNLRNRIGGLGMSKIYGTDGNILFESNGIFALVLGRRKRLRFPGFLDIMGYRGMLKHFLQCVRDGETPSMSLAVARRDLRVITAAYRSLTSCRFESAREDRDAENH